ncbi:MAG: hypothetical protein K2M72_06075 [Paramuribaculum sp.]|nr:hypothetical protein [Paramuribaculum sp.]
MKKLALSAAVVLAVIGTACGNKEKTQQLEAENTQLSGDLREALATQDSLLVLVNDITDGMNQIKDLEHILATPSGLSGESSNRKEQIRNDMIAIQQSLQQRRERLAQLEEKLKKSNGQNATLLKTVENLKSQIAEQETEIATLHNQLAAANIQITSLNQAVDSLNRDMTIEKEQRVAAQEEVSNLTNDLNACYYVIGTKQELKQHDIIEGGGFLRKTKVLQGEFDRNYFTRGDIRTLTTIPLHSKKGKVLTQQPKDTYEIVKEGEQAILRITNVKRFWETSNLLVVQVD